MRRPIRVKTFEWSFPDFFFFRSAKPPLSPPFHPHSLVSDFSLGASWVFSIQQVLLSGKRPPPPSYEGGWARTWSQSPELGGRARLFGYKLSLYAAACMIFWLLRSGS